MTDRDGRSDATLPTCGHEPWRWALTVEGAVCLTCKYAGEAVAERKAHPIPIAQPGTQEVPASQPCTFDGHGEVHCVGCCVERQNAEEASRRTREATADEAYFCPHCKTVFPEASECPGCQDAEGGCPLLTIPSVVGDHIEDLVERVEFLNNEANKAIHAWAEERGRNDATAAEVAGIPKSTDACDHCEHYGDLDRAYIEDTSKLKAEIQRMGRSEARPEGVERARGAIEERRMVAGFLRGFGSFQPAFSGDMLAAKIECCEHHKRENRWEPIGGEARPDAVFPAEAVAASVGRGTCGLCKRTFPPADSAMCCRCDGSFVIQTESGAPEILRPDRSKAQHVVDEAAVEGWIAEMVDTWTDGAATNEALLRKDLATFLTIVRGRPDAKPCGYCPQCNAGHEATCMNLRGERARP